MSDSSTTANRGAGFRCALTSTWKSISLRNQCRAPIGRWGMALLVVMLILGAHARPAAARESRVLPQLRRAAAARPNTSYRVIVTRIRGNHDADRALVALGGRKLRNTHSDSFVAYIPGRHVAALGSHRAVKYVAPDAPLRRNSTIDPSRLATRFPTAVDASELWPSVTGKGVGVAIVDTGVTDRRDDWLDASGRSRVVARVRFSSSSSEVIDESGHGTHVAGIIAGNSWRSADDEVHGRYIGVAPDANIIDVKVADAAGMSYVSDVVDAIDWVVDNRKTYNIRVMNLSLVSSVAESYRTSVLAAAVEHAWFNGILVVVAAGNAGPDSNYYPPANDPFVITVGAVGSMGTDAQQDDRRAPWSSYGVSQDGINKPDVVAPGRYMVAPLASPDASLAQELPRRIVDGAYIKLSGTSMAAPVVSGIAALAFQAHPEWTNDQVKWLIHKTAVPLIAGDTPIAGQGAGEINAAEVVEFEGTPGVANQGLRISEQLIGPRGSITYDGITGSSASSWSTSSWSTSSWSTSSWSTSSWSTSNQSTATWSTATDPTVQ